MRERGAQAQKQTKPEGRKDQIVGPRINKTFLVGCVCFSVAEVIGGFFFHFLTSQQLTTCLEVFVPEVWSIESETDGLFASVCHNRRQLPGLPRP